MKFVLLLLVFTTTAFADQCAWNDMATSRAGKEIIKSVAALNGQEASVYEICEPCGETVLKRFYLQGNTENLSVKYQTPTMSEKLSRNEGMWEVAVTTQDGIEQSLDLAYTYVKVASGRYANVAALVGCPAQEVSSYIEVEDSEIQPVGRL